MCLSNMAKSQDWGLIGFEISTEPQQENEETANCHQHGEERTSKVVQR